MTEKTAGTRPAAGVGEQIAGPGAAAEFERVYRANVDAVSAYFARRVADPQLVADLTADTFVAVITVNAKGIPAGDILVVAFERTVNGRERSSLGGGKLTSPPAPGCVSLPPVPAAGTGGTGGTAG